MTFENLRCQFVFSSINGLTRIACGKRRSSYLRSEAPLSIITPRAVTPREPDPPPKRLSVQEERAALWDALGLPPHKRGR